MKNGKTLFIYNPSSGKGQIKKHLEYIKERLETRFLDLTVIESESEEHFKNLIKNESYKFEYVIFSGGDGTFNMAMNSLPENVELPVFGYLPGGSTCDMAYNVNCSKRWKKGVNDLIKANIKEYSVGVYGDHRFIYVCDFGVFTDMPHVTPQEYKRKFGLFAYAYYCVISLFKTLKLYDINVNGVDYKTPLICFSNSKEIATFKVNKDKDPDDHVYYCVIVRKGFLKGLFKLAYFFAFGVKAAEKAKCIYYLEGKEFTIDCKYKDWDVDGEYHEVEFPTKVGYSGINIKLLINR